MSADDTGDFKVIRASTSSSFVEVRLYAETLSEHIPDHHPEIKVAGTVLGSMLLAPAIEETVSNPTKLQQSAWSAESEVFTCDRITNQEGDPLVVAVKRIAGTTSGRVQTAYFSDNDYPGTLIWSTGDE